MTRILLSEFCALIVVIMLNKKQDISNMKFLTFLINRNFIVMKIIIVKKSGPTHFSLCNEKSPGKMHRTHLLNAFPSGTLVDVPFRRRHTCEEQYASNAYKDEIE